MPRQFIVTVHRAKIDAGELAGVIRCEHQPSGRITEHDSLVLDDAVILSGRRQDGARVWIEAAGVEDPDA